MDERLRGGLVATATARAGRFPTWLGALIPLITIAILVTAFVVLNPIGRLREVPPVEAVAFERTVFREGLIEVHVRNDGPDPVTVSQVLVNDAYRDFTASDTTLGRLKTATFRIPYPWSEGLPVTIGLVTSTGLVLDHEVAAATLTPEADLSTLGVYALLGVYIGLVPVLIGLLWFPSLRRASRRWLDFFLALTLGLLVFLLVDTIAEGLDLAAQTAAALNGLGLFALGAIASVFALTSLQEVLRRRGGKDAAGAAVRAPLALAYLIATGIGLHNLGEGLAVGAALSTGELALGTFLVVGFALHNTTEGLAIVAPLGGRESRPTLFHFAALGAIAGAPTILGAWIGGFAFAPASASLAFGIAAGAIAQVVWQIAAGMDRGRRVVAGLGAVGFVAGFVFMYATGLLVA
jgi:ZIP family zinc transporter